MTRTIVSRVKGFLSYFLPGFPVFFMIIYIAFILTHFVFRWLFLGEIIFDDYFGFVFRASLLFGFGLAVWIGYTEGWKE